MRPGRQAGTWSAGLLRVAVMAGLLAFLSGGCTLVEGAWDALVGGEEEEVEHERTTAGAREVIGESLRDDEGRFDPSLLLRVGEDAPLLTAADPSAPERDAGPGRPRAADAAEAVGAAGEGDQGGGTRPAGAATVAPREAAFRRGEGRGDATGDREAARAAARNPPAPEPPQSEAGGIEMADLVLELGVIALIAAAFVSLLRAVLRHPVWAVVIAVVLGLMLTAGAYGGAG